MEIKCQKCGEVADDDQAFCSKCGAVLGMGDAGAPRGDSPPNLAATVIGKFPLTPSPQNPPASQPPPTPPRPQPQSGRTSAHPPTAQAPARPTPPPTPQPHQQAFPPALNAPPPSRGGGTWLLVTIGFFVVLLVGALLIYLFLFNLR